MFRKTTTLALSLTLGLTLALPAAGALLSSDAGFSSPEVYTFDGGAGAYNSQSFANLTGSLPDAELAIVNSLGASVDVLNSTINHLFFDNAVALGISGPAFGSTGVPDPGTNSSGQIEIIIDSTLQIVKAGIFMSNADVNNTIFSVDEINGQSVTTDNQITVANKGDGAFIGWDNGSQVITSLKIGWNNNKLIAFDDLTLQAIPEPGALVLAIVGAGLMLTRRRA